MWLTFSVEVNIKLEYFEIGRAIIYTIFITHIVTRRALLFFPATRLP